MCRKIPCLLAMTAIAASPLAARSKSSAVVAAANAAKAEFHAWNGPAARSASEGAGVANRSLKVVVAAVNADHWNGAAERPAKRLSPLWC